MLACRCCVSGLEARVSDFADEGDSEVQRCRVEAASDNFGIEATQDFTFRLAGKSLHLFFYWVRNSNAVVDPLLKVFVRLHSNHAIRSLECACVVCVKH